MAASNNTSSSSEKLLTPSKAILGLGTLSIALLTATPLTGGLVETVLLAAGVSGFAVAVLFGAFYAVWQAIFHPEARSGMAILIVMALCVSIATLIGVKIRDRHPDYWEWARSVLSKGVPGSRNDTAPVAPLPKPLDTPSPSAPPTATPSVVPHQRQQPRDALPLRFSRQTALGIVGGTHPYDANILLGLRHRLTNAGFQVIDNPSQAQAVIHVSFVRGTEPQPQFTGRWVDYQSSAVIQVSAIWNDKRGLFFGPVDIEKTASTVDRREAPLAAQREVVHFLVDQIIAIAER